MLERKTVVAAEDDPMYSDLIAAFLRNTEYELVACSDGKTCVEEVCKRIPRLVLLDIMMPGMSGLEALARIKADQRTSHVPVIMLTGKGEASVVRQACKAGADDFLVKPYQKAELLRRMHIHTLQLVGDDIKMFATNLRVKDPNILQESGLESYRKPGINAYPARKGDVSLCVLLQAGVDPQTLQDDDEETLSHKIRVFAKGIRWRRIWPAIVGTDDFGAGPATSQITENDISEILEIIV